MNINIALTPLTKPTTFNYGTWDIEASGWWDLQVIGCYDGSDYYQFRNVPEFLDHIMRWKYRDWRWFAHFGGRYDLNFVFDYLRGRTDCKVSFYCSGSMVLAMDIRKGDCHARLCDSFRLLPASLRSLTVAFDVKHQKTNYDFSDMHYCKELLEYNEQDCRGLYEVLEQFFEQTGMMSETFASHSLKVWRKDFLKEPIWKPHASVNDFVRRSYHGGRVEVFKRKSPHLMCYDVNSMYPYVMRADLPIQYIAESRTLKDNYFGFVHAEVQVPECYIPVLPLRQEKLFFPIGRFQGVWSNEELQTAENFGCKIQKIIKAVYFRSSAIFQEFVTKLYHLKKNAEEPTRTIAKYLLNSFYGKFGQQPVKRVYVTERDAPSRSWPIMRPDGHPSGFAYYERTSNAAYLLPHLSSAVTSKARLHLLTRLNSSIYYCDTDSVFTTDMLDTGKEIGDWSLVGEGECQFWQPKLYKFKGEWKAKGLDRSQSIDAFVNGDINKVIRRKSIKEALRDGKPATMDMIIEKRLRESRPKRHWIDGQDTRPWTAKELEDLK
ncbi:hypothetical protein L0244_38680 [bacterium]|nr:hypothetical protein [bacterium]